MLNLCQLSKSAAGFLCLALGASAVAAPGVTEASGDPQGEEALLVGDISAIDLQHIRRVTDQIDPEVANVRGAQPVWHDAAPISLQMAVDIALSNNLDLDIARADREMAAREVPVTEAKFHPLTGLALMAEGGNVAGESETQGGGVFVRQEVPTGGSLTLSSDYSRSEQGASHSDAGFMVEGRQPLMRGGRTYVARREILEAGYTFDVADAQLEAQILRVTRDAKVAYYETILANRLIEVTQAAVERDKQLIEASEALFEASRASRRDVVSAQIRLSDDLAQLASRRAELRQAQLELRDVLGLPLARVVQPAESSVPFSPVPLATDAWVERALNDRPEVQELLSQLKRSDLQLQVSGNDVLPQLDLLGRYRRSESSRAVSNAYDLGDERWFGGLEFSIPIGNVAARERHQEARIAYQRAERELERQMRTIEREVRAEVIELRRSLVEVSVQADKVERSREKLAVAVERYRLGIANNLDITDAQEDLLDAETDLLRAIFDYTNGLVRLEASIGGPI